MVSTMATTSVSIGRSSVRVVHRQELPCVSSTSWPRSAPTSAFYRSALRTDPKNNELLDRAFISSVADGDIDEAVKLADRILTIDKSNRVARLVVGVRDLKLKKYAAAQTNINQSVRGPSPISSRRCCPPGQATARARPRQRSPISTS